MPHEFFCHISKFSHVKKYPSPSFVSFVKGQISCDRSFPKSGVIFWIQFLLQQFYGKKTNESLKCIAKAKQNYLFHMGCSLSILQLFRAAPSPFSLLRQFCLTPNKCSLLRAAALFVFASFKSSCHRHLNIMLLRHTVFSGWGFSWILKNQIQIGMNFLMMSQS